MKKIILLAGLFVMIASIANAQAQSLISKTVGGNAGNSLTRDTVTNTAVKNLVIGAPGPGTSVTIQVDVTKISGTLGGTIIPVASNDNVNFYANGSGTYTVTDVATQGVNLSVPVGWRYYGVRWTGTGTMSGSIAAKLQKY